MPGVIRTHLLPQLINPADLAGSTAVIIDQLRASTTISAALASGAFAVVPFLEPEHALQAKERSAALYSVSGPILLGGERGGVLIPGFDLANSPRQYTSARVAGKTIHFTTTNGTRAIQLADKARASVFLGCLGNLSVLVDQIAASEQTVHLICAGTQGRVTLDDVLAAGAIADRLTARGHTPSTTDPQAGDDLTLMAIALWRAASADRGGVIKALLDSRAGRNLCDIGLREDVIDCARLDTYPIVPWLGPTDEIVDARKHT